MTGPSVEEQLRTQIRSALTHAKISQAEAARRLGISAKHMSHLMTGRAPLTLAWAERITDLCGVRVLVTTTTPSPDREDRIRLDDLTSDALDALYEQLEAAEAAIARARALAERWRYTGDRKEGPLRELRQALDAQPAPAPATPAWTPPPPGSTREQLPAHILALLDGRLPDYRSTACQTADAVACAADVDGYRLYDEIRAHAERLHERCRLNHKFTGQLCACGCHPQPEPDTITDPAWLRDQYATAVEGCGIESLLDCGEIADAVLRVRDRHVEQLRQRLTLADQFHRTVVAERDRLAATIREVLALFQRATVCGRTAFYQATEHPIHPDDYDRWTAALPKEPTR